MPLPSVGSCCEKLARGSDGPRQELAFQIDKEVGVQEHASALIFDWSGDQGSVQDPVGGSIFNFGYLFAFTILAVGATIREPAVVDFLRHSG